MGLGYGSEYQLMRFLGHHREELDKLIREATGKSGDVHWLDFPYDDERISGDGELKGIECFKRLENYADIEAAWKKFWPQRGSAMNWDGVFTIDDTWFFVEAKAHEEESYQKCSASSEKSIAIINEAFEKTKSWLQATPGKQWITSNCYQLANRLAFLYFCHRHGIKARLVYIGFLNGFRRRKDEVTNIDEWERIWKEEFEILGLDYKSMTSYISYVYPICENR